MCSAASPYRFNYARLIKTAWVLINISEIYIFSVKHIRLLIYTDKAAEDYYFINNFLGWLHPVSLNERVAQ